MASPHEKKLNRLLFLAETKLKYVAGNPENYFLKDAAKNLEFVKDFLNNTEDVRTFVRLVKVASRAATLPRRVTLYYALAFALIHTDGNDAVLMKNILVEGILAVCRTFQDIFKFISIFTKLNHKKNKITSAVGHVVNQFLNKKPYKDYANEVGKAKSYHGWKYKDLIKLSHYKTASVEKTLITSYVLFGLEKLKCQESAIAKEIYNLLEKFERLRKIEDEDEACDLITELHANINQVNPKFIKSQKVWSSIIPELSVREVLELLPRLYKYGLLRSNTSVHAKIIEAITSKSLVVQCKLHPLEVYIHMKNYEKGGKPLDPKLEQYLISNRESYEIKEKIEKIRSERKCSEIISALTTCWNLSFTKSLFKKSNRIGRIVLALDLTRYVGPMCFKNKNITCIEAQWALARYYHRIEEEVQILLYKGEYVRECKLEKQLSFPDVAEIRGFRTKSAVIPNVFQWACINTRDVDVFICFMQSIPGEQKFANWKTMKDKFLDYQKTMNSPHSKLVLISLCSPNLTTIEDIPVLTICGFCPEIPNLIHAFVTGMYT